MVARLVMRARDVRGSLIVPLVLAVGAGGCGDALLPSDYAGPPAAAVEGTVLDEGGTGSKDVERPRLSVQWLAALGGAPAGSMPLIGQSVAFQRSARLDSDWEIGLSLPSAGARLSPGFPERSEVRLSVGKMVYYDDRVPDGRFDWSCLGERCDTVKAVSAEYLVFVDLPPTCPAAQPRVRPGYHYYRFDDGQISDLALGRAMSFVVRDRPLTESGLTTDLRAFANALLRQWTASALGGC